MRCKPTDGPGTRERGFAQDSEDEEWSQVPGASLRRRDDPKLIGMLEGFQIPSIQPFPPREGCYKRYCSPPPGSLLFLGQ